MFGNDSDIGQIKAVLVYRGHLAATKEPIFLPSTISTMVFGFFSRKPTVAGPTVDEDPTTADAPEAQPEVPQPIEEFNFAGFEKAQSKAAFAFWKEREQKLNSPAPSIAAAVATPPPATPTPPPQELVH
ncbi:hypothetical protein NMY22_g17085 [Coprinellus aureogranulatus]|nr:hypothetical protein NMY22_g17085 [Coprinellus aureogranulatus]